MIVQEYSAADFEHVVLESFPDVVFDYETPRGQTIQAGWRSDATIAGMLAGDALDAGVMAYATALQGYGFSPLDRLYASALATHERAIGAPLSARETVRALAFELDRVAE